MINYRDHRGSLKDSLATSRQFDTLSDLGKEIGFDSIEYYGIDDRCMQVLYIVMKDKQPIGFVFDEVEDIKKGKL